MKVQEVMERANMTETGRAIAYIKDAMEEINMISPTHVTTVRMDIMYFMLIMFLQMKLIQRH